MSGRTGRRRATEDRVVKSFGVLRDGPWGRLDVRVLETASGRRLDIREHVESEAFTGYTRRGLRLSAEEFALLLEHAAEIGALLEGASGRGRAEHDRGRGRG